MPQNPAIRNAIAIALGAIPGALSRYYILEWSKITFGKDFAYYGTFFINVTGCFLIALFLTLNAERFKNLSPEIRLIVATGFCGAYTTFSTYGLETFIQLQKGNSGVALLYWIGSAIIGIIAIQLGVIVGRLNKAA
ncbi:fluoride efflux transporter CrcB [Nostoc sp. CHAB 5836]|uniref:fluoride efflux transporter CrcB n=1 Tax=Nostoc sp. CHAB 5836 TaxID=2780404 RepID=UPI001E42FF47|nr:fluoride efflux transporter CrcB [Nostoc sp. CHAB 5836]MCC5617521.1 fluoride efflux transporter CrcB [Nostoc sp. CHAB 5836]